MVTENDVFFLVRSFRTPKIIAIEVRREHSPSTADVCPAIMVIGKKQKKRKRWSEQLKESGNNLKKPKLL